MMLQIFTLAEFFAMKGRGDYIWSSYAIALVVLCAMVLWPWVQHRNFRNTIKKQNSRTTQ